MAAANNSPAAAAASPWSSFKGIGHSLKKFFFLSPADEVIAYRKILFIALEAGQISFALGSRIFSRIRLAGFKRYPLEEPGLAQPEALASSTALVLAELGAGRPEIALGIPKSWAVIKTVELPISTLENISQVITYELDRLTPFNPEEAFYDFKIINQEAEKLTLLLVAARADRIDPYLTALLEKGLKVSRITVNLLGLGTLCRYIKGEGPILFSEIDENGYEGAIFHPDFSLEPFGGVFPVQEEKAKLDQILGEIENPLEALDTSGLRIETIFWFKASSASLKEQLKARLNKPHQFLGEMDLRMVPPGKDPKAVSYPALGGVLEALWLKASGLNLLSKGRHEKSKNPILLSVLLLIGLLLLLGLYWITPIDIEKKKLANLENQIAQKKVQIKKVEAVKKEIETVRSELGIIHDFKHTRALTLDLLREITRIVPANAWLTRIRITEAQVSLEGYAPSATVLVPKLEESRYFKKVEFAAPTFRDPKQNLDRFQVKMELEGR